VATPAYYFANALLALLFLAPIVWAVWRSFLTSAIEGASPTWASLTSLSFDNYRNLASAGAGLGQYLRNSVVLAVSTALITGVLASGLGYAVSRIRFRGASWLFALAIVPFMVPFQAMLTPLFLVLSTLHLTNGLAGLIMVSVAFQLPFGVFVMRNSFASIPASIEEAAMLDGASTVKIMWRVMGPLAAPGLVTVCLYAFLAAWNDLISALTLLTNQDDFPITIALSNMQTGLYGVVDFGLLNTGAVVSMIPCIVLFVVLQRFYIRGLIAGALK
jgi:multiple sugar transport system permease protein